MRYTAFLFSAIAAGFTHNTTSWIDHCLLSGNMDVCNYEIRYNLAFYDHLPVFLTIETCITREQNNTNQELLYKLVDWSIFDRNEYCDIAESIEKNEKCLFSNTQEEFLHYILVTWFK